MKSEQACAWRRRILVLGMVFLGLVSPQAAGAAAGGATDPVDNEVGVDIVRVGHTDSATVIQYSLEAAGAIGTSAQQEFLWSLDLGGGAFDDISIQFNASSVSATVDCTSGTDATATVSRASDGSASSTAANTIVVRFPRSALTACGLVGNQYRYVVAVNRTDVTGVVDDVVPDSFLGGPGITHTLTPVPPTSTTTVPSTSTTVPRTSTTTVPPTSTTRTAAPATSSAPLTISPTSVAAGGAIRVQADGFAPESSVTVLLVGDPVTLATGKANAAGNVDLTVTIPANTSSGQHRVVVRGTNRAGGVHEAAATVTVTVAAAANRTDAGALARTGSSAQVLLLVAAVLMLAGLTMELSSHRRQLGPGAPSDGASQPAPDRPR